MFDDRPRGTVGTEEASLVRILRELDDEGYFKASVLVICWAVPYGPGGLAVRLDKGDVRAL